MSFYYISMKLCNTKSCLFKENTYKIYSQLKQLLEIWQTSNKDLI